MTPSRHDRAAAPDSAGARRTEPTAVASDDAEDTSGPSGGARRAGPAGRAAAAVVLALLASAALLPARAAAEVLRVEITSRQLVLDGRSFGDVGPYEKITGTVHFGVDPTDPANARITDIGLAPVNGDGLVTARANFMVLRPEDPDRGADVALLEVSNRGGKAALGYLNGGGFALDPSSPEDFGDGLLMRRGLTIIWVGWQWDVPSDEEDLLRLRVPVAENEDGSPIRGLVRSDRVVDEPTRTLDVGHRGHRAYPVADTTSDEIRLTVRDGREAPRREIPSSEWGWARPADDGEDADRESGGGGDARGAGAGGSDLVPSRRHVHLPAGFEAGKIYELVYPAEDPRVVGLGLAAVRDMISYAKHDPDSPFAVEKGFALGISQTGRFLRHFLYQGFNVDEEGRRAFDGMMVHTAGAGRGSFNHRFAQPSRDAHRFSAFFYPTDIFPFSGRVQRDSVTGRRDGLLALYRTCPGSGGGGRPAAAREGGADTGGGSARDCPDGPAHVDRRGPGSAGRPSGPGAPPDPRHLPTVFYTNTGYEYWGRAGSLLHTSLDGSADVETLPKVRVYHLASGQHFVDGFPPADGRRVTADDEPGAWRGNPLDFLPNLRALAVTMTEHLAEGTAPPPARHPRVDDGTMGPLSAAEADFPAIPGVEFPEVAHVAYRADYGPRWPEGVVTEQPPELGPAYPSLVARLDSLGNELGGVRNVAVRAPLATYAPWSLRTGMPGPERELADFRGTFVPLPWDAEERRATGDPRPAVTELYGSRGEYLDRTRSAARALVREGFLLEEDVDPVVERATERWDWMEERAGGGG